MERITFRELPKSMYQQLMTIEDLINESPLDFQLLELLRLRVAQINGCAYCVDMHHKELKSLGESDLRLSGLCVWKETPYFTERERVVLAFTEKLSTLNQSEISDDDFEQLLRFFDKTTICWLSLAISQINTWTQLTKTCKFEPGHYQVKVVQ